MDLIADGVMQEIHDATELVYCPLLTSAVMVAVHALRSAVVALPASCVIISVSQTV